jgi:hypothetical protein
MDTLTAPQLQFGNATPDRAVMVIDNLDDKTASYLAWEAVSQARQAIPRVTGRTALRLQPIWGNEYFGIWFPDNYVWYMEKGTKPFTMRSLAGKTIPMWVEDPGGQLRAKNPKMKVRRTEDGRTQVLIFRRAAKIGQRKQVFKKNRLTGQYESRSVAASYPGAPGRIANRIPGQPFTPRGKVGGRISGGNIGVRWRHPGLQAAQYINSALARTAFENGLIMQTVYFLDGASWEYVMGG